MNLRQTFLLAACALCTACTAPNIDSSDVLAVHGTNRPYVARLVPNQEGGQTAMLSQAFEGWRFLENRDGTCDLELSRVLEMVTLSTPPGPVQQPVTKVLKFKVDCSALTQDTLPAVPSTQPAPPTNNKMI